MSKIIKYHKSHKFKDLEGVEHQFVTQLYSIGVYGIMDNDPQLQSSMQPSTVASLERKMLKLEKDGKIVDFSVGTPVRVTDVNGFWEEVHD